MIGGKADEILGCISCILAVGFARREQISGVHSGTVKQGDKESVYFEILMNAGY